MNVARPAITQALGLAAWLGVAFAAAAVGAVASVDAAPFYAQLNKPSWAPPGWLFGPVWSVLYTLMGVAAWLVWRSPGPRAVALGLFAAQLMVNALWSWLFFAWHQGALAMVEILLLLALIVAAVVILVSSLVTTGSIDWRLPLVAYGALLQGSLGSQTAVLNTILQATPLVLGGLAAAHTFPEVDQINYLTRVTTPVLMINGRHDAIEPLESSQLPMFRLWGTPAADKKHVVFDTGHGPFPQNPFRKEILDFLDKYFGVPAR